MTSPNTYCFDNPTQIVFDGLHAENTRSLKIRAYPCTGESCLPEEEIRSILAKEVLKLNVITNVYSFYPEDYSEETMVQMKL